MVVYSVHDVVADTWSFPQVSPTKASAIRDFNLFKSRPNVPASDIECVLIGTWDPDKGFLIEYDHSVLVARKAADEV